MSTHHWSIIFTALELSVGESCVGMRKAILTNLANRLEERGISVEPAAKTADRSLEAASLRSRLNQLNLQTGRSAETTCARHPF